MRRCHSSADSSGCVNIATREGVLRSITYIDSDVSVAGNISVPSLFLNAYALVSSLSPKRTAHPNFVICDTDTREAAKSDTCSVYFKCNGEPSGLIISNVPILTV